MIYKYYKFPDKESVPPKHLWPNGVSYYEIGLIGNNDAVYDEFGKEVEPQTYIPGWHINVACSEQTNLDFISQYEINVNSPRVVWLGQQI